MTTSNLAVVLAGLVFFLASVGGRAHVLLDWPALRAGLDTCFLLAAGGACLVVLRRRPLWALALVATLGVLAANAFAALYQPSLRPGIPVQDYLLADQVSANYSWDQVVRYLTTTGVMLLVGLAARVSWTDSALRVRTAFLALVAAGIGLNLLVIAVQGFVDLTWLAAGSGTALDAGRAAGLLEDSGASTVFVGAALSGIVFLALSRQSSLSTRVRWGVVALVGAVIGAATGGRVFFLSVAASGGIALGWMVLASLRTRRQRVGAAGAATLVGTAGLITMLGRGLWTAPVSTLNDALVAFDVVRSVHVKVMFRAWMDHPLSGSGFGMFYANFWEHLGWALVTGGAMYADVPGSMYMMLLSELGLAGLLIIAGGVAWLRRRLQNVFNGPGAGRPEAVFAAGVSVSLAISLLVGIHVIFWSVPALLIPIVVGGAGLPQVRRRWIGPLWGAAIVLVAASTVHLWATAPRAPEFRWAERGTPQIPVSLVVPIWPERLEGVWATSGAEFLFDGTPLWFHIERPRAFYPMTFTIEVFDRGGRHVTTSAQVFEAPTGDDPGRLIQVPFDDDVNRLCATSITPQDYCTFTVRTTPVWGLDGQQVAVLYVTRNLRDTP